MTKKIMILGAGVYQVPLIQKANELGYETIVVSYKGNYPGFKISTKNIYEDTTNFQKLSEIAVSENIHGVCTSGTDVALISLGKICDTLNLFGPSYEAVKLSTDKKLMKEAFIRNGVKTAQYKKVSTLEECQKAFDQLKKPVIFKAVDSSGSRGIKKIIGREEINDAYAYVKAVTKKSYFLIEEFITGEEFGAQAFVYNNEIEFIMPHGDIVFQGDAGVPVGHYVPYHIDQSIEDKIKKQLNLSIKALNLNNCALNADFILSQNDVYVLEIGARAGATCLPEMVGIHYGFDYFEYMIKNAVGERLKMPLSQKVPCAAELLMAKKTGIIKNIKNLNTTSPEIIDISFDYEIGEKVNKFNVGPDRIGQIIATGETLEKALLNLENTKQKINIIIE